MLGIALALTLIGVALATTGLMLFFSNRWGINASSRSLGRELVSLAMLLSGVAILLPTLGLYEGIDEQGLDPNQLLADNPPAAGGQPLKPATFTLPYQRIAVLGWGTPSDTDTADSQTVETFTQDLSRLAGDLVSRHAPGADVEVIQLSRDDYTRLRDAPLVLLGWCEAHEADLLVAVGLGSTLTNSGADYALWREPVYEMMDCRSDQALRRIGRVNERRGDRFPYQIAVQDDLISLLSRFSKEPQ